MGGGGGGGDNQDGNVIGGTSRGGSGFGAKRLGTVMIRVHVDCVPFFRENKLHVLCRSSFVFFRNDQALCSLKRKTWKKYLVQL